MLKQYVKANYAMPFADHPQLRITELCGLMQSIFWIAFDQVPLETNSDEVRSSRIEGTYPKLQYSADEEGRILFAKEELQLSLIAGLIPTTGFDGDPEFDDDSLLISKRQVIISEHWHGDITEHEWTNNLLHTVIKERRGAFTSIYARTADLFTIFHHANMKAILAGHVNNDEFIKHLITPLEPTPPSPDSIKPSTIAKSKHDYEQVQHYIDEELRLYREKITIKDAAIKAAQANKPNGEPGRSWEAYKSGHSRYRIYIDSQKVR